MCTFGIREKSRNTPRVTIYRRNLCKKYYCLIAEHCHVVVLSLDLIYYLPCVCNLQVVITICQWNFVCTQTEQRMNFEYSNCLPQFTHAAIDACTPAAQIYVHFSEVYDLFAALFSSSPCVYASNDNFHCGCGSLYVCTSLSQLMFIYLLCLLAFFLLSMFLERNIRKQQAHIHVSRRHLISHCAIEQHTLTQRLRVWQVRRVT